jgi:hypothetical protein
MLPDEMDGQSPAPKIADLDGELRFNLTDTFALVTQGSFNVEKITGDTPSSNNSFSLDEAALFAAGSIPQTNWSYFAQYELYQDGQSNLEQANVIYTFGRANSSAFFKVGEMHMQEGEGTRAAAFYSLFPDPSLALTDTNALNFTLDQHPVGIDGGYTWASPYFKKIFAVSSKVTNGLNADGSEILSAATKNGKDFWLDADFWFAEDSGITFATYQGSKDQIQNQGTSDEFTYRPRIRRYGLFGDYMIASKVDVLGRYIRSSDDWQDLLGGPISRYTANAFSGEVDYYPVLGTAIMARFDHVKRAISGIGDVSAQGWSVGASHALTQRGNVVIRSTFGYEKDFDPSTQSTNKDKHFEVDLRLMW